jgi:hypothetical protein
MLIAVFQGIGSARQALILSFFRKGILDLPPMIMDTFSDTYDFSGVTIIPFNTHEGSSDGGTYSDMTEHRHTQSLNG